MRPPTAREQDSIAANIAAAMEVLGSSYGEFTNFRTKDRIVQSAIAHALIAIAQCARIAIADSNEPEAALRECRRIAFEDAEILAGRWYAVVRDTDLLEELRARAKDPLAPLSLRYVGGHLADAGGSAQNATDATPNRPAPGSEAP